MSKYLFLCMAQGSPHIVKTGRLDFSLSWLKGEVREKSGRLSKIDPNFDVSFPTTTYSLTFHKMNVLHNGLKKDAINEFGIKYWTSNPVWVKFQEHGNSFYKCTCMWILMKKYRYDYLWTKYGLEKTDKAPKFRFSTEIGRFHWNQGEEVTHFAWFGEPWYGFMQIKCHSADIKS